MTQRKCGKKLALGPGSPDSPVLPGFPGMPSGPGYPTAPFCPGGPGLPLKKVEIKYSTVGSLYLHPLITRFQSQYFLNPT